MRLILGSLVAHIAPSHWIIITTFLLALFLALAKRRDDVILADSGLKVRANIDGYNRAFLDAALIICAVLVMVAYIFYSIDSSVLARFGAQNLYFTAIFVLLGIFRYLQITLVLENSGSPSEILLRDRFLQCTILAWIASFVVISHFGL